MALSFQTDFAANRCTAMRTAAERRKLLARGASPWNRRLDCDRPCKGETERLPPFQGWRFIFPRSRGLRPWLFSFAPAGAEQFTLEELRCRCGIKLSAIGHSPPYWSAYRETSGSAWGYAL